MARATRLRKCVKCFKGCTGECAFCGDAVCFYHSSRDVANKTICFVCNAKFYLIWQDEYDEQKTTELAYLEWMKQQIDNERLRFPD